MRAPLALLLAMWQAQDMEEAVYGSSGLSSLITGIMCSVHKVVSIEPSFSLLEPVSTKFIFGVLFILDLARTSDQLEIKWYTQGGKA